MTRTIGILHPGEMGSSVGAAARANGNTVLWCSKDRSPETNRRAREDQLEAVNELSELLTRSDIVLSVCPTAFATEVARNVIDLGYRGVYVDANAVSPETTRRIGQALKGHEIDFVDGGIVGPPARSPGSTILYLSGAGSPKVEEIFRNSPLETRCVGGEPGQASAVKMAFAAWTKGSSALLLATRALARAEGVSEALEHAWARFSPGLEERANAAASATAPKAWRFIEEMHQIATTFATAGLPSEFHEGAAEVYERMRDFKGGEADLDAVLAALLE